jgi:D-cysteine desulfhydrase
MNSVPYPERVELARTPTPLVHLPRTSDALGVELWLKRDDLTGVELSGNKVRKLEFLLAEARAQGADTILTCGGEQSNHCRATALAATRLGLRSHLVLRTDDPAAPPTASGNILLDWLAGATIQWISREAWGNRNAILSELADRLRAEGKRPYVIPEGGSNALGAWGYVRCAEELAADLAGQPRRDTSIVYACGSGGTGAGLLLGARLFGLAASGVRVVGVNVCDDRDYFVRVIGGICADFEARFATGATIAPADIDLLDGYVGLGYGKARDEELLELIALARRDAVLLDPVYTGKAFFGVVSELARDRRCLGERVVFVHTGGLFGLFPMADRLAALL